MNRRPVIIDTDPGIDDAAAITLLAADPSIDIKLVASVSGNVGIGHTTNNALKVVTFLGLDVPVARGAACPLMRENVFATEAHGASGMDGFAFPEPDRSLLSERPAIDEERRVLLESDQPVTLVTLGPLTNVALLLAAYPEVTEKIDRIIMMGGSTERGNISVYGEFNVSVDPEAAKMVFHSGVPIVMVGLDIGRAARLEESDLVALEASGLVGTMVSSLFRSYDGGHVENGVKMYDPSAALFLLEPGLFTTRQAYVDVEVASALTAGATVVDYDVAQQTPCISQEEDPGSLRCGNATVCVGVDVNGFRSSFVERISHAERGSNE